MDSYSATMATRKQCYTFVRNFSCMFLVVFFLHSFPFIFDYIFYFSLNIWYVFVPHFSVYEVGAFVCLLFFTIFLLTTSLSLFSMNKKKECDKRWEIRVGATKTGTVNIEKNEEYRKKKREPFKGNTQLNGIYSMLCFGKRFYVPFRIYDVIFNIFVSCLRFCYLSLLYAMCASSCALLLHTHT